VSVGLAIGWRGLSVETQDRLLRDTWLLMAGWIVIGLACSWLLLEIFHLRSPLLRYPITALVMYGLGVVAGTRLWLAAFARAVRLQPARFAPAPVVPTGDGKFRRRARAAAGIDPALVLGAIFLGIDLLLWFEGGARLFWWTVLTLTITVGVFALSGMARFGNDGLPGVLAELAHQFIFGRETEVGHLPRRSLAEALPAIVRETWGSGVTFLIFSVAAAVSLYVVVPGAASLADIFR
jgi:hypothetical protein